MLSLIDTFFDRFYHSFFNIPLHHKLFMKDLKEGKIPKCLIYAMCAAAAPLTDDEVVLRWTEENKLPIWHAAEPYLCKARSMSLELMEDASVDAVIALYLISSANFMCGKIPAGFGYLGMAVRMAMSLRIDVDPDDSSVHPPMSWARKEQRRRIWHCLWVAETCDYQAIGRSSLLVSHPHEVKAPAMEHVWGPADTWDYEPPSGMALQRCGPEEGLDIIRILLRSFQIGSTIFTLKDALENLSLSASRSVETPKPSSILFEGNSISLSKQQQIALLTADLDRFIASIPALDFESLYITPECPSGDPTHMVWCIAVVHLARHLCIIFLHMSQLLDCAKRMGKGQLLESTQPFQLSWSASHSMAGIFAKLLDHDPEVIYVAGNCSWMAFHSAIVLIIIASLTRDEVIRESARQDLDVHIRFMRVQSGRWFMADKLVRALEGIIEEAGKCASMLDDPVMCKQMNEGKQGNCLKMQAARRILALVGDLPPQV
ncbi:hypothetical protein HDV00_012646 [Rhizophlyctis rosea]|nr:hypothetical protein HDV00_012646 [Rhizophlyctis rosea]